MSGKMDPMAFVVSQMGKPHQHHRHCVHNLSAEEQKADWRRRTPNPEMYDLIYGDMEPIVCTPDDWEFDAPDIDWSALDGEGER